MSNPAEARVREPRQWLTLGCAVACASVAAAQAGQLNAEIRTDVIRRLQSSDAREVAWGAFAASQYRVEAAVPLIAAALARPLPGDDVTQRATELALLDTLVQLDAHVPVETLRPLIERWPVPTLILMANASGDRAAALLPLASSTAGPMWRAVSNLLLVSRPPGFAARLLSGLRLTVVVHVTSDAGVGYGTGGGSGSEHDGSASFAAGFPPLADYRFSFERPGATVLSLGPRPVYYERRQRSEPVFARLDYSSPTGPDDADRVLYLNALARQTALRSRRETTLVWKTPREFRRSVADERHAVQVGYESVIASLLASGLLTEDERRTLAPAITVRIEDHRRDTSAALPAVE